LRIKVDVKEVKLVAKSSQLDVKECYFEVIWKNVTARAALKSFSPMVKLVLLRFRFK
jgi:hypothetical protein